MWIGYATTLLAVLLLVNTPTIVQAQFTFTTNGAMIVITGYTGPGGSVVIPSTINGYEVTTIAAYAFDSCSNVTDVTIPNSVFTIGHGAFENCPSLVRVTLPNGLREIEDWTFERCSSLTGITIPNGVTYIGPGAFYLCFSLTNVLIPSSVVDMGWLVFGGCTNLMEITVAPFSSSFSTLDGVLFDRVQGTLVEYPAGKAGSYTVPTSVHTIAEWAFYYCPRLTSLTIPYVLYRTTSIGAGAFASCTGLTNVAISTNVTSIPERAFQDCASLTTITIPRNVTTIGYFAFALCSSLRSAYFRGNAPDASSGVFASTDNLTVYYLPWKTGWGTMYGGAPALPWNPPAPYDYLTNNGTITLTEYYGPGGSVVVPSTINGLPVKSIGDYAFYSYPGLNGVTIGSSITNIGRYAFSECASLGAVYFSGDAPSVYTSAFWNATNATCYYFPGTAGWRPQVQSSGSSLGVHANGFGFSITGTRGLRILVEGCTDPASSVWSPVQTITLTGGTSYFSDPMWTNYSRRFYRALATAFGGLSLVQWNPRVQTSDASFGMATSGFGFEITGTTNIPIAVEACTNLAHAAWTLLQTCTLTNGSIYFSDPDWTNYPARFYRIRSP